MMKKATWFILILVIISTYKKCINTSKSNIIEDLEGKYNPRDVLNLSDSDKKVLRDYYQTEEGKTHLQELEESYTENETGTEKLVKSTEHKEWVDIIKLDEKVVLENFQKLLNRNRHQQKKN